MDLFVGVALACVAALVAIACATVRFVPAGHHAVITRAGAQVRSSSGGVVAVAPGIERLHLVAIRPPAIDPLSVVGVTQDGVEVQLVVSVLYRIVDAPLVVASATDSREVTSDTVERTLHHLIAETDLVDLLTHREDVLNRAVAVAPPLLAPLGVELTDIDLIDTEVRMGAQLLRLLTPG